MIELITEILIYLGITALLGLILGYLIWGWGLSGRVDSARAEGAAMARTSVDGEAALQDQLTQCKATNRRLEVEIARLSGEVELLEEELKDAKSTAETEPTALAEEISSVDVLSEENSPEDGGTPDAVADMPSQATDEEEITGADGTRPLAGAADNSPDGDDLEQGSSPGALVAPESLLTERPDIVDDLKRIKGVGNVMESILNDKGIYQFKQLAAFSVDDVAWVNDAIEAFPGRIERDEWVRQAQELYLAEYGRPYDAPDAADRE